MVGGRVRDALLRRATSDTDIVVPSGAIEAAAIVAEATGGRCIVLDERRDVARVLWPPSRVTLDVAARAGPTLEADLAARDFTINAMAVPLAAELVASAVIDPTGGLADLAERRVRLVSEAALDADPLRLLRGPRVAAELGFELDAATAAAISNRAPRVIEPAAERVRDEVFRILALPDASSAIEMIDELGLSAALGLSSGARRTVATLAAWTAAKAPELPPRNLDLERSKTNDGPEEPPRGRVPGDPTAIDALPLPHSLAALQAEIFAHFATPTSGGRTRRALALFAAMIAPQISESAASAAYRLRLSASEVRRLEHIWKARALWPEVAKAPGDPRAIHRLYRRSADCGVDAILLELAESAAGPASTGVLGTAATSTGVIATRAGTALAAGTAALDAWFHHRTTVLPKPLVDGRTLIAATGREPGPWVQSALEAVCEAQAVGRIASAEEALELVRHLAPAGFEELPFRT